MCNASSPSAIDNGDPGQPVDEDVQVLADRLLAKYLQASLKRLDGVEDTEKIDELWHFDVHFVEAANKRPVRLTPILTG